jgi:starch synthase
MKLRVLLVSNQVRGIDGTGGLGDVASALPKALAVRDDIEIRVLTPGFKEISGLKDNPDLANRFNGDPLKTLSITFGRKNVTVDVYEHSLPKSEASEPTVICYLLRADQFDRANDSPEQAILLCRAAVEFLKVFEAFRPDVIHCNDWHSGLIPVYLNTLYSADPYLGRIATLYTTHNAGYGYQGAFPTEKTPISPDDLLSLAGLQRSTIFLPFRTRSLEHQDRFIFAKGGFGFADLISTVSIQYAHEILTPAFGGGFEDLLKQRAHDLCGIVDGIDTEVEWNPAKDTYISHNYSKSDTIQTVRDRKQQIRQPLRDWKDKAGQQPFADLKADSTLIALVGRIASQKFPILLPVLEDICKIERVQVAVLGDAHPEDSEGQQYAEKIRQLAARPGGNLLFYRGFDIPLSHLIYAASDMFLVPSTYEPCGLTQLISMRYGTVPVVRFVGGLVDTVIDEQTGAGANGFGFQTQVEYPKTKDDFNREARKLLETVKRAINTMRNNPGRWHELMKNGMARDSSWSVPATQYMKLYDEAVARRVKSHFLLG